MGVNYSPKIVTSGLVVCLDAGNRRSYPGSGTTWTDTSGNGVIGTLTNGPTFNANNNGSIVLDGLDDFVDTNTNIILTEMTLMGFIYPNGTQAGLASVFFSRGTSPNVTGLNYLNGNIGYHWNDAPATYDFNSNLSIPINQWSMIGMSVTSTAATLYVNTNSVVNTISHTSTTIDNLEIGRDSGQSSRFFNGNTANMLLYNRALSATEILQNFNAIRGRFGV